MTLEIAAFWGMGAVLVFGLVALLWALVASDKKSASTRHHHA